MNEQETFIIENNVLIGINRKDSSLYEETLEHDYVVPENVVEIQGENIVPFSMRMFQITTRVKKIDVKAFRKCACIKKFVVVDADTQKVIFRKRFEVIQGSCHCPNITQLSEFRKFIRDYPENLSQIQLSAAKKKTVRKSTKKANG